MPVIAPKIIPCLFAGFAIAIPLPAYSLQLLEAGVLEYDSARNVMSMSPLLDRVRPGVVSINTVEAETTDGSVSYGGIGSGVIVDAGKGLVVTNNHVIKDASAITVTTTDKRAFDAKVLGRDPDTDLALIQISGSNLTALPVSQSDDLRVGDFVVAIGSPFGLSSTVTTGIVSALDRSGDAPLGYTDFIQTDASINPGNSGGALVNSSGELIGINSALATTSGSSSGIGFAVPVRTMRPVIEQLETYGTVDRGTIGVMITPVTQSASKRLNLPNLGGSRIVELVSGGAAQQAGLAVDDVIVRFGPRRIENSSDLRYAVGNLRPQSRVTIEYYRDGSLRSGQLTVRPKTVRRNADYVIELTDDPDT